MSKPMARLEAEHGGKTAGTDHAGDRTGFHHGDRLLLRGADRHHRRRSSA